jgi:YHS domain-containing protein
MEPPKPDTLRSKPLVFDPVCGAPVDEEGANQFHDGESNFSFCSAFCRRLFLDEQYRLRTAGLLGRMPALPP